MREPEDFIRGELKYQVVRQFRKEYVGLIFYYVLTGTLRIVREQRCGLFTSVLV